MRSHKHRARGTTPELREVLDKFYNTPAGKKLTKNAHIAADISKAKTILENLLEESGKNRVSSITLSVKGIDI
jgi:hypothetical protein